MIPNPIIARYQPTTFVGNFNEDLQREADKMDEFLRRHAKGEMFTQRKGSTMRRHLQTCYITPQHGDGNIHFGDFVMMQNGKTQGFLSCDLEDKLANSKFGVSCASSSGSLLRNVFQVVKPQNHSEKCKERFFRAAGEDNVLHYNEKFCLANTHLSEDCPLMLHTTLVGPNTFSRVSKKQQVAMVPASADHDVCWQVLAADIRKRTTSESTPVKANSVIVINHCATNQHLSADSKPVRNSFGMEDEVCCHRWSAQFALHNKTETEDANLWAFVTAPLGAHHEEILDASFRDSGVKLQRVQEKLAQRAGTGGYRSMVNILKTLDSDGNHRLDSQELAEGLKSYGILLDKQEVAAVMRAFDRDGSGTISIMELLRGLRKDMNPQRRALVLQAFALLDKTGDGKVNMDDMMAIYGQNINRHPDVQSGTKSAEKVLLEFSACWDKDGNGTITEAEFLDYYNDISATIDNDKYFELMVRNAWHISGGEGVAQNTTCRRVLVTHFDGRQTVEEIKNDLGIRATDFSAMRKALSAQGIHDIRSIQLYG